VLSALDHHALCSSLSLSPSHSLTLSEAIKDQIIESERRKTEKFHSLDTFSMSLVFNKFYNDINVAMDRRLDRLLTISRDGAQYKSEQDP